MNREDRLFTTVGGCVVVMAGAFFLWSGARVGHSPMRADEETPRSQPAIAISELTPAQTPAHDAEGLRHALLDDQGSNAVVLASNSGGEAVKGWQPDAEIYLPSFVSAVNAIAEGKAPADELGGLLPSRQEITVREDGDGRKVIAAGTFRRYAAAVDAIADLDAASVVGMYQRFAPQIAEAGGGDGFEARIKAAVDHLLAVEIPDEAPEMASMISYWDFADEEYAQLSEAQKHLLRMGADNAEAVKAKLRELRDAFGWEAPAPATLVAEAAEDAEESAPESTVESIEEPVLIAAQDLDTAAIEVAEPEQDDEPMIFENP